MTQQRVIENIEMRNEEVEYLESISIQEGFEIRGKQFKGGLTIVSISPINTDFFIENYIWFLRKLIDNREDTVKKLEECLATSKYHY